jgi:hypothetical protein
MDVSLKNPAEVASRLELSVGQRLLLIDPPDSLLELARREREGRGETRVIEGRAIRTVKDTYDAILLWREDRVGSQSLLEAVAKRAEPGGVVWTVVPLKKTMGLATPAAHRLGLPDLERAFPADFWTRDREARVSAWHVGYRFVRGLQPPPERGRRAKKPARDGRPYSTGG